MANTVRGEAEARVGDITITLVATMDGLARLSAATGRPLLPVLYERLVGTEMETTRAAIELFTTGGKDAEGRPIKGRAAANAALEKHSLADTGALQQAFSELLAALIRTEEPASPNG